ncbi:M13 family metallopeptidase, partial [Micrococcus sp.]|uniref:M13 family metallopeptidase n=1 Tax=Micrococcus sp. TaxID=1271 RepID=UPI0026DD4200
MTETLPTPTTLDVTALDPTVRPQDDLFRHVNGPWLEEAEIPDDKALIGAFRTLADQAEASIRDIITTMAVDSEDADEARIAGLYASFMDEDRLEELGGSPLRPMLAQVDAATDFASLTDVLGDLGRVGVDWLVSASSDSDPGDPGNQVLFVGQSGLGLPDEAYYRLPEHAETKAAYRDHVQAMFEIAGLPDPAAQADRVLDLESRIAACHWDKVRSRDLRAMYNPMPLVQVHESAPGLELARYFTAAGFEERHLGTVVNAQPSFFTAVAALTGQDFESWLSWARWNVIAAFASYLSSDYVAESFRFFGTVLTGTPKNRERWKRGVSLVEGSLGEAVGRIYVERHFSPKAKDRMDELVADLIEAYRRSITALDWMTEETKAKALDKLGKFTPKIGFPAKWKDYSSITIDPTDLVENVRQVRMYAVRRLLEKVGKPVDRDEWFMTPQTVNAYYHPLRNEIVFPAAILRPPFFDEDADDAVNFGG